ncbi:MAG: D-alanyl-D-alanine carboxypeptidase family protein, partial [Clostridia bacterium]
MHKFFKCFLFFLILINIDIVSANTINQTSTLLNSTSAFTNKPNISAGSSVVIDANSDTILYNKNMNKKIYPASTTKILTAIIAIEKLNLDDTITVRKEELELVPEDSSIMYLQEGEVISVRDLLYGLMLKSGNDAANVLAYEVSGNLTDFVSLMNEKAKELHCTNTHFTNAHGFHDDNHYSTSIDMANILKYCIKNEIFKEITQTKKYKIEKTNKLPARYLTNTNNLVKNNYEFKIGGKTGFTNEAGNVLVSYAVKDDVEVVLTLYDGTKKMSDRLVKFDETLNLLNYTFDNFSKKTILKKETINLNYVDNVDNKIYNLKLNNDIISLISKENY